MATGRTISASFLTDLDHKVIKLCKSISESIYNSIPKENLKKEFKKEYGKISYTRDAGLGLGGGKLQRDAVCTRGRQGKAPFSNRNLRWHPLMVAEHKPDFANKIERIEIEGEDDAQVFVFIIKDPAGKEIRYPSDKNEIVKCPVCRLSISQSLEDFRKFNRGTTWQPSWRSSKKKEGDDSSIQIMHVNPLVENKIKHNASNVRYGHRWCNVAMTDHSLEETLDFMEFIVKAHNKCK